MATTENGVYYQDDYTKIADILADMEKMAESIDELIEKAKYDDTDVKNNIKTIQDEQKVQNDNIEDIQTKDTEQDKLIQKLQSNMIQESTEEATQLHIEDASELPAKLDVRGNHHQKVTETAENIFDGKLELGAWDYTSGEKVENSSQMRSVDYIDVSGQTQITIVKKEAGTFTVGVRYYADDKSLIGRASINNATDAITTTIINNLDPSKTVKYATLTFIHSTDTNEVYGVNKGDDLTWHDFIPNSPSLDYPSEVRAVGDNINIFDKDNMNKILATPSKLTIIASSSGGASFYLEVKSNTDYTISRKIVGSRFVACTSVKVPAVGTSLTQNIINNSGDVIHIKTSTNDKYLLVYYLYNNTENEEEILSSIKVEEGTEATSYSPYGQGSVEIKKLTENVIDLSKSVALYNTEITEIDEENGIIKVHRTNTQDPSIQIFCNLPAGQYTMLRNSHNFGQVSVYGKNKIVDIGSEKYKIFNATENITDIRIYSGSELPTDYEINFSDIILVMGNVAREDIKYVKYQESSYILDIQQPMLSGDYFVKEADGWKEVHTWNKVVLTGNENSWSWNTDNLQRVSINVANGLNNQSRQMIYSNNFIYGASGNNVGIGFLYASRLYLYYPENITSLEDWKALLQEKYNSGNPVYVYYPLATPTKLACTEAQSNVLDQLNELELFKGTNNIITAESLALMQMQYIADTETYIDNRIDEKLANINQQLLEIVGGN